MGVSRDRLGKVVGQFKACGEVGNARGAHIRRNAEDVPDEVQVFDAGHELIEIGIVRNVGDLTLAGEGIGLDRGPADIDLAGVEALDADGRAQRCGLARAVVADEAVDLARGDVQAQIVHGDLVAEGFCEMLDTQHGVFLLYSQYFFFKIRYESQ